MPISQDNIIYFDGICNLCNGAVQWIIKHDPTGRFKYCSLQSSHGKAIYNKIGIPQLSSIIVQSGDQYFKESKAILHIMSQLSAPYRVLSYIGRMVPSFIADAIYRFIAKRRYKWFGQRDSCMIPNASLRDLFLD